MANTEHQALRREPSIAELYRLHSNWLRAIVRRKGGGESSEDVVQEAFLRASLSLAGDQVRHPKALLLKIAQNILRDSARSALAAKNVQPLVDPMGPQCVASPDQVETVLLKQVVLALPDIYRDVFLLSRFGGMSYDQIAAVRGISVKTVEWRMSRAMAMCAARMRE